MGTSKEASSLWSVQNEFWGSPVQRVRGERVVGTVDRGGATGGGVDGGGGVLVVILDILLTLVILIITTNLVTLGRCYGATSCAICRASRGIGLITRENFETITPRGATPTFRRTNGTNFCNTRYSLCEAGSKA